MDGDVPVIDAASGPLLAMLDGDEVAALRCIFTTEVTRTTTDVITAQSHIACAIDMGEVRAAELAQPICEIELELIDGDARTLFDLARGIDETVPVRLGVRSKAERGYRLLEGRTFTAAKAEPIVLGAGDSVGTAFRLIAQACLRQFRLNEALLQTGDDAEPVHQARVALRRLRSAFSLFARLIDADERATLLGLELRQLAAKLGDVRDLDVLIARVGVIDGKELVAARAAALERARTDLSSARTRLLMIDLAEWLAVGDWRKKPADTSAADDDIRPFAQHVLARQWRRLRRRARHIRTLDDAHRHRVRIAAKKLRYATAFFASAFPGKTERKHLRAFLAGLKQLQDCLGQLNDLATGTAILDGLGIAAPPCFAPDKARLLDRAADALRKLKHTRRYWRD